MNTTGIPEPVMKAAVGMLKPFCPDLTPERLAAALLGPSADVLDDLMTVKEAAAALHVSRRTVERLMDDPDSGVKRLTIRGAVRLRKAEVLAVMAPKAA